MTEIATIDFHGDRLFVFEREGDRYVAMRPIVEALGLDWSAQYRRICRDEVLMEGVAIMATPSAGGAQETICLPLDLINGWLFGVDASRVRPELRDRITLYRRECYRALAEHFGVTDHSPAEPAVPAAWDQLNLQDRRQLVNEARVTFDRQSARELWRALGLPMTPAMYRHTGGQSCDDLKARAMQFIQADPGASQTDLLRRFQRHGAEKVRETLTEMERAGLVRSEARQPKGGGRPATLMFPAAH